MSSAILAHCVNPRQSSADSRLQRAHELLRAGAVHPVADAAVTFAAWVESQERPGIFYYATLGCENCECPDRQRHGSPHLCKHLYALRAFYVRWFAQQTAVQP